MWLGGSVAALGGAGLIWACLGAGSRASAPDAPDVPGTVRKLAEAPLVEPPPPPAPAPCPELPPPAPVTDSLPHAVPVMPAKAEVVIKDEEVKEVPAVHAVKSPLTWVNSRRIKLNYEVREVGPSGVSAVELWATRDGKTWQCYSNEPPPAGPLVVHVAEEGCYGFTLVV
jgi:hypothetical protein